MHYRTKVHVWRYSRKVDGVNYGVLKKESSLRYSDFGIRKARYFNEKQSVNNFMSAIVLLFGNGFVRLGVEVILL